MAAPGTADRPDRPDPPDPPEPAGTEGTSGGPFGQRVPRTEDARLLTGRGRYVADIRLPGMLQVAFVRSPHAHARILGIDTSAAESLDGVVAVVTGVDPDFAGLSITGTSALPSHVETPQRPLAVDKVRFQGEAVVAVVAVDRYIAEDGAELVDVEYEPIPAHVDARRAHDAPGEPVHDQAPDNVLVSRVFDAGDVERAMVDADLVLQRSYHCNRHSGTPIEGRGAVAQWDEAGSSGQGSLTLHATSQTPHIHRSALARSLGPADHQVRVIAGDVGGGFGVKAPLYVEDLAVAQLARRLGRPVAWIEDRVEHLQAAAHARDHHYEVRGAFAADGTLIAIDAVLHANVGAYSGYPWTAGLEPLMAGGLLSGPYKLSHYRCDVRGVCTNTAPTGPYRGVARPATVFVMDRLLDDAARILGLDPVDIRRRNLVTADDVPWTAPTRLVHDSRTYVTCLSCYNELTGLVRRPRPVPASRSVRATSA